MKLFQDIIDNTYQIVQYKTKDHINNKFYEEWLNWIYIKSNRLIDTSEKFIGDLNEITQNEKLL